MIAQTATMIYKYKDNNYLLNLIDTPVGVNVMTFIIGTCGFLLSGESQYQGV